LREQAGTALIVGLGNPGPGYRRNRHNLGFVILERLAADIGLGPWRREHRAVWGRGLLDGRPVLLAKPATYMNRSGSAVRDLLAEAGLKPGDLFVLHDDLDMETGKVRFRDGGGHGGHNGLRSIIDALGTRDFKRIKVGIGRPPVGTTAETWVLGDFSGVEKPLVEEGVQKAVIAVRRHLARPEGAATDETKPADG
jgi:PTH1 family peptidyl-tRNA hydrolase